MLHFRGDHGHITVHPRTGRVVDYSATAQPASEDFYERQCPCGEWGCIGYSDIARVEVAEWRSWRGGVLGLPCDDGDDILAVAGWTHDLTYIPAEADWRAEAEISRGKRPVPAGHWSVRP